MFLRTPPREASNPNSGHQPVSVWEAQGRLKEPQSPQLGVPVVSAVLLCNLKLTACFFMHVVRGLCRFGARCELLRAVKERHSPPSVGLERFGLGNQSLLKVCPPLLSPSLS